MAHTKIISNWLFFTCFMVVAMAVIGAITRLTESGLSITEWNPVSGAIPPLNEAEWTRAFDLYKQSPEYMAKNIGMSMAEFKTIFFWEWFHRLWGRLIGVVYAVPLLFFWIRGMIPQGFKGKLILGLILGGAQGVMGWYMVMSGLVDRPDVSHYRLAAHLGLAFIIFAYLYHVALELRGYHFLPTEWTFCLKRHGVTSLILLAITIIWGAFTAGLEAGRIYNTWPLMEGSFTPPEAFASAFENHAWVQFTHRWLAALTFVFIAGFAWRIKSLWLTGAVTVQFVLGVLTLLSGLYIPLAAAHQLGALILLGTLLFTLHKKDPA